jgi:hypothetical protein
VEVELKINAIKGMGKNIFFSSVINPNDFRKYFLTDFSDEIVNEELHIENIADSVFILNFYGDYEFTSFKENSNVGVLKLSGKSKFILTGGETHFKYIKYLTRNNIENDFPLILIPQKISEHKDDKILFPATEYILEVLSLLNELTEKEKEKLSPGASKLWTKKVIEESEDELINMGTLRSLSQEKRNLFFRDFWEILINKFFIESEKRLKSYIIREKYIFSNKSVIRAFARTALTLIENDNKSWKNLFEKLFIYEFDYWSKENKFWVREGIIKEGAVHEILDDEETVTSLTKILIEKLNIDFQEEAKGDSLFKKLKNDYEEEIKKINKEKIKLEFNPRKDKNISLSTKKVYCYFDFFKNRNKLIARVALYPTNIALQKYNGLWMESSSNILKKVWKGKVIDLFISDPDKTKTYIEILELARNEAEREK